MCLLSLINAASMAAVCSIIVTVVILCCLRQKSASYKLVFFWKKKTKSAEYVEAFLKKCGSFAPKRYSYSDIKKMTNSFKDKLGQGGYSDVYEGKLPDNHIVAVKVE